MKIRLNIFWVCLLIIVLLAGCGGGSGGGGEQSSAESTAALEQSVKSKAQNLLPPAEYSILESKLTAVSGDPNYSDYLNKLDQAMDNFTHAFEIQQGTSSSSLMYTAQITSMIKIADSISQMKATLVSMFGNILSDGNKAFLDAGMGYSRGKLGGAGGSITATWLAGGGVHVSYGAGSEQVYDFIHFQKALFPVSECLGGITIAVGGGGGASGDIEVTYYENWIFGFKNDIVEEYTGPAIGVADSVGVEGALVAGLGIEGGFGSSQGIKGLCTVGACPATLSTDKSSISTISYAVGMSSSLGFQGKAQGSFSGAGTSSCVGAATGKEDFLDISLPVEIRYITAGWNMGADILKNNSSLIGFGVPAASTAVLYGLMYDNSTQVSKYTISGQVTYNGSGLAGVTVSATGLNPVSTDTNGNFTITGAANGNYTLTFFKAGYSFNPASVPVTVDDHNIILQQLVSAITEELLLDESFENNTLDNRVHIETIGNFNDMPGIKDCILFGSGKAFGFGRTTCGADCWDNNISKFIITFPAPIFVSTITFKEMEFYGNWGSGGRIYVDGTYLTDSNNCTPLQDFGRCPYNDYQADTSYRTNSVTINKTIQTIEIQSWDITNQSELFIDDLKVYGNAISLPFGLPYERENGVFYTDVIAVHALAPVVWGQEPQHIYQYAYYDKPTNGTTKDIARSGFDWGISFGCNEPECTSPGYHLYIIQCDSNNTNCTTIYDSGTSQIVVGSELHSPISWNSEYLITTQPFLWANSYTNLPGIGAVIQGTYFQANY